MKITLATLMLTAVVSSQAQWVVPPKATAKVDLQAAPPRTRDGKPDFSGVWEAFKNRPCPPDGCADQQLTNEFVNMGLGVQGGVLPYLPWAADLMKQRRAEFGLGDPSSVCLPLGLVKVHTAPFPRKIVQTPDLLLILSERDTTFRQIFLDGRALPEDPNPSWNGYSSAHWQDDALVVETNGLRDGMWIDREGSPLTDAARITERFRRPTMGRMEVEMTVNDPKAYSKPWTAKLNFTLLPGTELLEYYCTDNDKNAVKLSGK